VLERLEPDIANGIALACLLCAPRNTNGRTRIDARLGPAAQREDRGAGDDQHQE
jgi:hypothetical protein